MNTHNNMVATGFLEHIGYELRGNRCSALVLFVLPCIREEGKNGGDSFRTGDLACMYHNAQFHKSGVDLPAARVDNVHIVFSNRFDNADIAFANAAFVHFCFAEGDTQSII